MEKRIFTRLNVYGFSVAVGSLLVILLLYTLVIAISRNDHFKILLESGLLLFWGGYTFVYWRLYKKEKKKQSL